MFRPAGSSASFFNVGGVNYPLANGVIDIPDLYVLAALAQGWTLAGDVALVAQSAEFPTQGLVPGFGPIFHRGLNKPLWRNAANSGWVDATGGAVVP